VAAPVVVIMAAGHGTRMRSGTPKVLHPLCGRPLVLWPVGAARDAGAARIVVVDGPDRALAPVLPGDVTLSVQAQARGTGDAVAAAADHIDPDAPVIVLSGDVPLVTGELVAALARAHAAARAAATVLTIELDDPGAYGRVVRGPDGGVERVVEAKAGAADATAAELAIREVNAGIYAFAGRALLEALPRLAPDNVQGELYLPDVLPLIAGAGGRVAAHLSADHTVALGVNDRADLAAVARLARARINRAHMLAGVTLEDPATTYIEAGVTIGADTVVSPGTSLLGGTRIGGRCRVGPHATLVDAVLGDEVTVVHSHLDGCQVQDGATVGPFAYLRPGAVLREGAKAGTFVEIKNSDIGAGAKVPHLSYVGDAEVGERTNLGAATITANYDGRRKHRTTIGANVHTAVDTTFVAPVSVGDDAYTGAGSVITKDVPPGALGIARERQRNIEGYAKRVEPGPEGGG
jgi:bifunctional UDP-N-acetylglucosamine pyrophosphorylase / glucosamine-1-phosphate N-acetyltransferase